MKPQMGRPKIDNPRSTQLGVRLTKNELDKLDFLSENFKLTRAETIRKCIELIFRDIKK